ncbi:hypothetical protein ABID42_004753 [Arcicella rosea]|uniref:hypothetical protein n=1 Tax=Arcicella rosea TaxID=502909 RepID=UPI00345C6C80
MKNQLIMFVILCFTFFACQKDETPIINSLVGKWNVTELQFSGYTQKDSTVKATNLSIEFDACDADKNNTTTSGCSVFITENGVRTQLVYQVQASKDAGNTVYLNGIGSSNVTNTPAYQQVLQKWSNGYDILESGDNKLVIKRKYNCSQSNGVNQCDYMKVTASR